MDEKTHARLIRSLDDSKVKSRWQRARNARDGPLKMKKWCTRKQEVNGVVDDDRTRTTMVLSVSRFFRVCRNLPLAPLLRGWVTYMLVDGDKGQSIFRKCFFSKVESRFDLLKIFLINYGRF